MALVVLVAGLVGGVIGVLAFGSKDTAGPRLAERPRTTSTQREPAPHVTRGLEPGEVGVIVAKRRVEVALAYDKRRRMLEIGFTLGPSSGLYNQIEVGAGRYVVIAREPSKEAVSPVSGFAQAPLRVR